MIEAMNVGSGGSCRGDEELPGSHTMTCSVCLARKVTISGVVVLECTNWLRDMRLTVLKSMMGAVTDQTTAAGRQLWDGYITTAKNKGKKSIERPDQQKPHKERKEGRTKERKNEDATGVKERKKERKE